MNVSKGIIIMLSIVFMSSTELLSSSAMAANNSIVIYFSHAGENYGVGNVAEGNTAKVAKAIANRIKVDVYEIKEAKPYPVNYQQCVDLAKEEQRRNARPEIAGTLPDLSQYKVIYVGYPNWWGDCPMIVYSFLEKANVDGKIIVPFCTHEGSGLGVTAQNLKKHFPKAKVIQKGLAIKGTVAQNDPQTTQRTVEAWLKALKVIK